MENIGSSQKRVSQQDKKNGPIESNGNINYLPESVMFVIFSLLPLVSLVSVSNVSKQWETLVKRYLLERPSSLSLDEFEKATGFLCTHDNVFLSPFYGLPSMDRMAFENAVITRTNCFRQYVDRILHLLNGCIIKKICFKVCYDGLPRNRIKIDQWFKFVMKNEVKELELNFSKGIFIGWTESEIAYVLPPLQWASKSLEHVSLMFCNLLISNLDLFGYIQSLFLKYVEVLGFSIEDLATKCPMLKDLKIEGCNIPWNFMICKKEIMIKSLALVKCSTQNWCMCPIDISAPELLSFTLEEFNITPETNIKAPNLQDVVIAVDQPHACITQQRALVKLLGYLRHCKTLSLNIWCIQVLSYGAHLLQQSPIPFENLKHLKLGVGLEKGELPGIAYLLCNCPAMESITLYIYDDIDIIHWVGIDEQNENQNVFDFDENQYWQEQASSFRCIPYRLKEATVFGIFGKDSEIRMLRFLLENAYQLEELYVYTLGESLSLEIHQQLTTYRKASPRARIFVFGS